MHSFKQCQEIFNQSLKREVFASEPANLYDPVRYILSSGGKRIRPILTLMAYNIYEDDIDAALYPAIAIEMFHNFTLIHDDIMDSASLRRNRKTVHHKWNTSIALLSGDAMSMMAYRYLLKSAHPNNAEILSLFTETALRVCEGQQFDMDFEKRQQVTVDEYLHMIRLKTSVLIACSLKIGALVACAPEEDARNLYEFGINLGLAFQLQDDLLDAFGEEESFGKTIGNDIRLNKKTYLLIKAFEQADDAQKKILEGSVMPGAASSNEKVKRVISLYEELGIKEITAEAVHFCFKNAMQALKKLKVPGSRKEALQAFVNNLYERLV